MRTKTVPIPVYFGNLIIIVTDDFKKVNKVYKTKAKNKLYDAVVFESLKGNKFIVAIKVVEWSIIAHEVVHLVNDLFLKRGILLDRVNDEPQAYMTGWVTKEIETFLKEISDEINGTN